MTPRLWLVLAPAALWGQSLMPWPAEITAGQGRLRVDGGFRVEVRAARDPRVASGAARLTALMTRITGIPLPGTGAAAGLVVQAGAAGDEDESYQLSVKAEGARLEAPGALGALRGMATFAQLVQPGREGFGVGAVEIRDRPRFPYRGLLLDVARHWMPMDTVKRTLDAMEAVKFNVFHMHLSDNQGFRVESKRYPKLQQMGSDGQYFTQDEIREIVAYARQRGIRVIPEFDMPGHTTAWFVGYPELAAAPGPYQIDRVWGVLDPCMDPTKEEVYRFLDGFIGEMAQLFPDPYFHIGGDEVNGKHWNASARIQEFKRARGMKDNEELQAYFTKRLHTIVKKHGKRMVGWDEVLHPDISRDIVVHSWRGQKSLAQAASLGFEGILSNGYYLDLAHSAADHYLVDPINQDTEGLTEEQKRRILGGEACMWSEMVSAETVDGRLWPRAAAVAERLWSPATLRDVNSMYRRLDAVSRHLDLVGTRHLVAYRQMTERLAGGGSVGAVAALAAVVEPVKKYSRSSSGKYTSFTPLNRLVDTAQPESAAARRFGAAVDRYLKDRRGAESLRARLAGWRDNDRRLQAVMAGSGLLAEAAPVSALLAEMASAALDAMGYLEKGEHAPQWVEGRRELLERAVQPHAEVLLSVAGPMRKLIEAAR